MYYGPLLGGVAALSTVTDAGQSGVIRLAVVFGPSLGTTDAVVNGTRYLSSYLDHPGWFLASMALLMAWVA